MSEPHQSLSEQLKQAEIDKLKAEKNKLEFDLKFWTWKNFWTILSSAIVGAGVIGFYWFYIGESILKKDNIISSLDNAHQLVQIDTAKQRLERKSIQVKRDSIKYNRLLETNSKITLANVKLNVELNSTKEQIEKAKIVLTRLQTDEQSLLGERQKLQPLVDSLQNIASIEQRKLYTNDVQITFRIKYSKDNTEHPYFDEVRFLVTAQFTKLKYKNFILSVFIWMLRNLHFSRVINARLQ
jgi:hypothetical protein